MVIASDDHATGSVKFTDPVFSVGHEQSETMNMKSLSPFPLAAATLVLALCTELCANQVGQEQMSKLVEAAWKEPLNSIEVTMVHESIRPPMAVEDIRKRVEEAFEASDADAVATSSDARTAELEAEVQRISKEQQQPRLARQHIIMQGPYLYRMDETVLSSLRPASAAAVRKGEWDSTYVNSGNQAAGDYTHFELNHYTQMATVFADKQTWHREDVDDWMGLPTPSRLALRMLLGNVQEVDGKRVLVPNKEMIDQAAGGTHGNAGISVVPVTYESMACVEVNVALTKFGPKPMLSFVCDANDYSKVYRLESRAPQSGEIQQIQQMSDFDSQGYPRTIVKKRFRPDGTVRSEDKIAVEKVSLDPAIEETTFAFMPPAEYAIVDRRVDKPYGITAERRPGFPSAPPPNTPLVTQAADKQVASGPMPAVPNGDRKSDDLTATTLLTTHIAGPGLSWALWVGVGGIVVLCTFLCVRRRVATKARRDTVAGQRYNNANS